ncbi:MAG: U32 family peptidase [Clostridium sp.]|uniref:U32 family peptidase n=1 Tax=Clostridium sp. TaxID=1506 RepID=UPI0030708299
MNKIELLAPGGSKESIYAAVQGGADAIYMGGSKFSARAYANNLSEEELIEVVTYCHLYNVKVYIAFNTLIKENELNEALEYGKFLYKIGVDAVITQDMGLFKVLKEAIPEFEIHASTQMTIHNGEGAQFLKDLGFQRIVLSRELGLDEIKYISKDLGIETEVFVHGALCISYSGQCLMSSVIGGRSGNRGRCAQPCRLPYNIISKGTGESKEGYLLSPKDTCTIEEIKGLIDSGTSSLKIEGRMKKPEYVSGVVTTYKEAIDSVYGNKSFDIAPKKAMLNQLFNREGFSKAYLKGNVGRDMMAYNCPKNTGVFLGKVGNDLTIKLQKDIRVQDGVRTDSSGFTITNIIKGKDKVKEAFKGDMVKLMPTKYKPGESVYVTADNKLLTELQKNYEDIYGIKLPITIQVRVAPGEPFYLATNYDGKRFEAYGDTVEVAANKPMDKESIIKNLGKLGDTAFKLDTVEFDKFEDGFLRASSINSGRRELIEKVMHHIETRDKREVKSLAKDEKDNCSSQDNLELEVTENCGCNKEDLTTKEVSGGKERFNDEYLVCVKTETQLKAVLDFTCDNHGIAPAIAVDLFQKGCNIDLQNVSYENLYLVVPNIIKNEFNLVCQVVEKNISKIKGLVTGNLGIVNVFKDKLKIIGDYKLNILNSDSYEFYSKFNDISALSAELNNKELFSISKNTTSPVQIVVYGKYELMVSEYCVIGSTFGTKSATANCNFSCHKDKFVLKDRMSEEFLVTTDKYCRSHIYNTVPVNLVPFMKELKKNNIKNYRIDFIDETYEEVINVMGYVFNDEYINIGKSTKGHYKRGIE